MEHRMYRLRYRTNKPGIIDGFISVPAQADPEAELRLADTIGHRYCELEPNRRYIALTAMILADETILTDQELVEFLPRPQPRTGKAA